MGREKLDWAGIYRLNWRNFLCRVTTLISISVPIVYFLQQIDTYRFEADPLSVIIDSLQRGIAVWFMYGLLWIAYLTFRFLLDWLCKGLTKNR